MSGADNPRSTGYWDTALILARQVIKDSGLLSRPDGDKLAEAVTERLLGDFLAMAEMSSQAMFGMDGTGPWCSWCGKIPGPGLPAGHFQRGVFCDCKRVPEDPEEEGKAA